MEDYIKKTLWLFYAGYDIRLYNFIKTKFQKRKFQMMVNKLINIEQITVNIWQVIDDSY